MLKTIIFDFDGTLANNEEPFLRCVNDLSKKYNYRKIDSLDEVRKKGILIYLLNDLRISKSDLMKYLSEFKTELSKYIKDYSLFTGIENLIKELNKSYKIIILSSNIKNSIKKVLDRYDLNIDIYSENTVFQKEKMLDLIINDLGLKKNEIVYIGDETRDVEACKKIGVKVIAVTWGLNSLNLLKEAKPDFIAKNLKELYSILENMN